MPNSSNSPAVPMEACDDADGNCVVCGHVWDDHRFILDFEGGPLGYGGRIDCPDERCLQPCGTWGIGQDGMVAFEEKLKERRGD